MKDPVSRVGRKKYMRKSLPELNRKNQASEDMNINNTLLKSIGIAAVIVGRDGKIFLANREFENFSGYSRKELEGRKKWTAFIANSDPSKNVEYEVFIAHQKKNVSRHYEVKFFDRKGRIKEVIATKGLIYGTEKTVISFLNITEIIEGETRTKISEEKYRSLIESTDDSVYMIDKDCRYQFVNGRVLTRLKTTEKKIIGKRYGDFHDTNDAREFENYVSKVFKTGTSCRYEYKDRKIERYALRTMSPIMKANTNKVKYVAVVSKDITNLKKTEEKLKYLSLHDSLTGLYNRVYFEEEMHRLDNSRFELVGLIVFDIDGLKLINDTLGHDKGDQLLIAASRVIRKCFREGDVVARVGGDEFATILPNSPRSKVENICQRIKRAIAVYNRKNTLLPLSIATGFAIRDNPNQSMAELYREADNNMYKEKLYSSQNARNLIVKNLIDSVEVKGVLDKRSSVRFSKLAVILAEAAGISKRRIHDLILASQFHDVGNISVHEGILHKPGRLTAEEFIEVQKHSDVGHRIAQSAPDLAHVSDFILKHHEWWNGNGYPLGLKGNEIPLESRVIAIVDAYISMTSDRPHRLAMSKNEALAELNKCARTQFDPSLVKKFIEAVRE